MGADINPTRKPKTAGELANDLQVSLNQGMVTQMEFPIDDDMIGTGTAPSLYSPTDTSEPKKVYYFGQRVGIQNGDDIGITFI